MSGMTKTRRLPFSLKLVSLSLVLIVTSGCGNTVQSDLEIAPTEITQDCTPGYSPCLSPMSDYDCKGGQGDGPGYTGKVDVYGVDIYELDRDGDGVACI